MSRVKQEDISGGDTILVALPAAHFHEKGWIEVHLPDGSFGKVRVKDIVARFRREFSVGELVTVRETRAITHVELTEGGYRYSVDGGVNFFPDSAIERCEPENSSPTTQGDA